jgi:hypothetical protein
METTAAKTAVFTPQVEVAGLGRLAVLIAPVMVAMVANTTFLARLLIMLVVVLEATFHLAAAMVVVVMVGPM